MGSNESLNSRFAAWVVVLGVVIAYSGGVERAVAGDDDKDARVAAARSSLAGGMRERDLDKRRAMLAEAAEQFDACLELEFADEIEHHRVMREAGSAHCELAKSLWPLEQWNDGDPVEGSRFRPADATKHYRRASELLGAVSEYWVAKIGKLPKTPDEARRKVIAAGLGVAEMSAADADWAASLCGVACSLPTDDAGRKEAVTQAIGACKRVHGDYPLMALGAYAGIRGAGALQATGDVKGALALCEQVNDGIDNILSVNPRYLSDLRARICTTMMQCSYDKAIGKPERAIEIGEAWLASGEDDETTKAGWEANIRGHLAYAYFLRWASSTDEESRKKDEAAARKHIVWLEERKIVHPLARAVLRALDRGPREPGN